MKDLRPDRIRVVSKPRLSDVDNVVRHGVGGTERCERRAKKRQKNESCARHAGHMPRSLLAGAKLQAPSKRRLITYVVLREPLGLFSSSSSSSCSISAASSSAASMFAVDSAISVNCSSKPFSSSSVFASSSAMSSSSSRLAHDLNVP